jgi:predicted CXXCH cytochrome family protein
VSNWQQSDHAKAMSVANSKSIIADFNNVITEHFSQKSRFYIKNKQYLIDLTEQDKTSTYQVKYTFGHFPLQQYLVEADGGRLQVFPFAWDSREKSQGGQRWYPNYSEEDIHANDRLHWLQPLQNWNGMCADCHSDGLKRQYSKVDNSFSTNWDNINVGCQSCHGKMTEHGKTKHKYNNTLGLTENESKQALGWLLEPNTNVARWAGKERDNAFMDTCFSCHSLRAPLTDGISPTTEFLNQFSPTLLSSPLYYADGQIKEEVYVYGSFLQSKMYEAGVNCLDCHNKHTMKVKVEGNGLCLQCHNAEVYQQQRHIRHPMDSSGAQCVNCHMPETTYMGVDARRDHSFKIPRPHLSEQFNTPNACINCHKDEPAIWATNQLKDWYGPTKALPKGEQLYLQLQHNQSLPLEQHLSLINDNNLSEIKRASALMLLPNSTQLLTENIIQSWVESPLPLIRLAAAKVGNLLSNADKLRSYQSLLHDKYKAIRVAAANHLFNIGLEQTLAFKNAFSELAIANQITSWRGEGSLNSSLINIQQGALKQAILDLEHGILVDPYFEANYINLADLYRQLQQTDKEKQVYQRGLTNVPKFAPLHYAHGMFLIRSGDKPSSIQSFKQAIKYDENNPQYAYLYFLALDSIGKTKQATMELKRVIKHYQHNPQLLQLGFSFSQKLNDRESYNFFIQNQ